MVEIDRKAYPPSVPALYALYGGKDVMAYVGISTRLRRRIEQHLVHNSSTVTRRDPAVIRNYNSITEVRWWTAQAFQDPAVQGAAEQIAFDIIRPALRSQEALKLQSCEPAAEPEFRDRIPQMLTSGPAGRLTIRTLKEALDKISRLEQRIAALEKSHSSQPDEPS